MDTSEMMLPYAHQMQLSGILTEWALCLEASAKNNMLPHIVYKPRLCVDGNMWCALFGEDLQSGVASFGDTPEKAMKDFDINWAHQKPAAQK